MSQPAFDKKPVFRELERTDVPAAVAVLTGAFADDPLMRYLFGDRGIVYQYALQMFFKYILDQRLQRGMLPLGYINGQHILGLASIAEPAATPHGSDPWPFPTFMGPRTADRLARYDQIVDSYAPREPHLYLGVLGVHPRSQGRGYGGALLRAVQQRAATHPRATGVYLETTRPDNVLLYQRYGYQIVGQETIDDLRVWCMFHPNQLAA